MPTNGITSFKPVAPGDEKMLLASNNRRFAFGGRTGIALADLSRKGQSTMVRMALDFASDVRRASGDVQEDCSHLLTKYFPEEFV